MSNSLRIIKNSNKSPKGKKIKILSIFFLFSLLSPLSLFSQWQCPSSLPGYLSPVGESNFSWAAEAMLAGGAMSDGVIADVSFIAGGEYLFGKNLFYFEGGLKGWKKKYNEEKNNVLTGKPMPGIRELMYQHNGANNIFSIGMKTTTLNDFFVLNERAYSISYAGDIKKVSYNLSVGSVTKDFARNGKFCTKAYLYDLNPQRNTPFLGQGIGETNYAGFSASWDFNKVISETENSADEFSEFEEFTEEADSESSDEFEEFEATDESEEFGEFEEVAIESKTPLFHLNKFGVLLYDEFGSKIDTNKLYGGIFWDMSLPLDVQFKNEILYQEYENNRGFIVYLHLDKTLMWANQQRTIFDGNCYLFTPLENSDAVSGLSFANIYGGTVFRMDGMDMSFYWLDVKHSFMKQRFSISMIWSQQMAGEKMQELDLKIVKNFGKHLKVSGLAGMMNADFLTETNYIGRFELRYSM